MGEVGNGSVDGAGIAEICKKEEEEDEEEEEKKREVLFAGVILVQTVYIYFIFIVI